MPKTRKHKRKAPVTSSAPPDHSASHPSSSRSSGRPQATRTVIRRFHVLLKRQAQLQHLIQDSNKDVASTESELATVDQEIEQLGGLATYQRMSTIGQGKDRGGGSEKVLIAWMRELGLPKETETSGTRLR